MAKKFSVLTPRKTGRAVTNERLKARLDEQYEKKLATIRQHRAEHEKNMALEKTLEDLKRLCFEPIDYEHLQETEPWSEPPPISYEYLKTEAVQRVEAVYQNRLRLYAVSFAVSFVVYLIFSQLWAFAIFFAIGLFLVLQVSRTLKQKQEDLIAELDVAQQEIYRRQEEDAIKTEKARLEYEYSQQLQQEEYQSIMEGKPETVESLVRGQLEKLVLPVNSAIAAEINGPLVKTLVTLPDLAAIPRKRSRLLPTEYIEYEDKTEREINKQYMDLAIALLFHAGVRMLEAVPTLECIYTRGVSAQGELLMCITLPRDLFSSPGKQFLTEQAVKYTDMQCVADGNFKLSIMEDPGEPPEWDLDQPTRKVAVKVLKQT